MCGDCIAAVARVNIVNGARDKRVCLLMRMLGLVEIEDGWSHVPKHVPGVPKKGFDRVLRTRNVVTRHEDRLWNIMVNAPDTV